MSQLHSTSGAPARLAEAPAETQVLVWSMRCWLDGAYGQHLVWNHFASRLGPRPAHRALNALESLLTVLARGARRPLRRGPSCCPFLHEDEQAIAGLLTAAQNGAGEAALRVAEGLVAEGEDEVLSYAAELAAMIAEVEAPKRLNYGPFTPPPAPRPMSAKRTLH